MRELSLKIKALTIEEGLLNIEGSMTTINKFDTTSNLCVTKSNLLPGNFWLASHCASQGGSFLRCLVL
ncbi:unnamed protein product [Camellia sinensis]